MKVFLSSELQLLLIQTVAAFVVSLGLTRLVRNQATRFGLLDPCNDRSLHKNPLPRLGGVALALSVSLMLGATLLIYPAAFAGFDRRHFALLGGAFGMHIVGLVDDLVSMRPRYKLAGQLVVASLAFAAGLRADGLFFPGGSIIHLAPWLNFVVTLVWLVGITNAVNLIDGLDGLAAGVSVIALASFITVSLSFNQPGAALLAAVVGGAAGGFLRYNFRPASIFLGDSGSLFLGFMLAGLGIVGSGWIPGSTAFMVPLIVLALPIIDTAVAIFRRHLRRQPIFVADKGHIHHRLLARGHTPGRVAVLLYGVAAILGIGGAILADYGARVFIPITIGFLAFALFLQWLRFDEFEELGILFLRGFRHRYLIERNVRLREASARVATMTTMHDILDALEKAFEENAIPRAEIRLRRAFLNGKVATAHAPGRGTDEIPIWAWSGQNEIDTGWWEIALPLLGPDDRRMGSLVLWEGSDSSTGSLSHVQAISNFLRQEVQMKLHSFEWAIAAAVSAEGIAVDSDGIAVNADGVAVADQVMGINHTTARRVDDLAILPLNRGVAGWKRAILVESDSYGSRTRSLPVS